MTPGRNRGALAYILIAVMLVVSVFVIMPMLSKSGKSTKYSEIIAYFDDYQVTSYTLDLGTGELEFTVKDSKDKKKYTVPNVSLFLDDTDNYRQEYNKQNPDAPLEQDYYKIKDSSWLLTVIPTVVMLGMGIFLIVFMFRQNGGGRYSAFGKANIKAQSQHGKKATFKDVAGADEEKHELEEVVDFLKNPKKYTEIGARIPKGVLLLGPPGTGKTLLARAVAGEAGCPFFPISGSDFVEMFVGVGASRVRDLFEQAKKHSPSIIFIDEIDAVGRHRGAGLGGGHDEREQTLNQLLAEMDGFDGKKGVVILAATNRPDSLDPALLRPGRFDRRVPVELPDLKGREEILKVHAKNIRVGDNVDYNAIARMASGASGAELANMINEAALRAVRDGRKFVTQADLEESVEVVIAGYQKKNKIMTDKEKLIVSYHEVGHALVAALQSHSAPVTKITIIPRTSGALGYTMQVDEDEHNLMSREELENKIATLTGGRVAEDLVFHSITTGASNDIEQATKVARSMITRFGMNEEFGMVAFETVTNQYLGGDTSLACSESTAAQIDEKVVAAVRKQYDKAEQLLKDNMPKLHELAKYLYEKETITGDEFMEILNLSPDQLTTTRMETN